MAVALFLVICAIYGLLIRLTTSPQRRESALRGALVGLGLAVALSFIELALGFPQAGAWLSILWLLVLFGLWGGALGWLLSEAQPALTQADDAQLSRRAFLTLVGGGVLTVSVGSLGLTELLTAEPGGPARTQAGPEGEPSPSETASPRPQPNPTAGPQPSQTEPGPSATELANRIEPAPGTRPEITSNNDFYQIDINAFPVRIDVNKWRLEVEGLVENPLSLTLAEIRDFPEVTQIITLSCISNSVGGDLISTSRWTGVRLKDILERAGLKPGAQEVAVESEDGFYESVSMQDAMDERTLLVYEMNGVPLPPAHGYPLRIYIPNRYGMKQPKWIQRLEVIDQEGAGYWVDRGWSEEAFVNTTSAVDPVQEPSTGASDTTVPIGGIAYAGARSISKVEVQVDDGPWAEAQLRVPPLNSLTWVQWRYDWPSQAGEHTVRVRAYDGDGELQVLEPSRSHPDGATGIHEITFEV
jgi:DMSO/TMAO reductase YedYZ molybdopterin-dependent catalytic subunit